MKNTNEELIMLEEAHMTNYIYDDIRLTEEKWNQEYRRKTRYERFIYNSKINIGILKNKNMSLKDKIFTIVWGA